MATFTIRVPDEMHERIKAAADEDRRSMNSEIEWLLDAALTKRQILADADARGRREGEQAREARENSGPMATANADPCPDCGAAVTSWEYVPGTITVHPCGHQLDMDRVAELRWDWDRRTASASS